MVNMTGVVHTQWGTNAQETSTASFCLTYGTGSHRGMSDGTKRVLEKMQNAKDTPADVVEACSDVLENTDMLPQRVVELS